MYECVVYAEVLQQVWLFQDKTFKKLYQLGHKYVKTEVVPYSHIYPPDDEVRTSDQASDVNLATQNKEEASSDVDGRTPTKGKDDVEERQVSYQHILIIPNCCIFCRFREVSVLRALDPLQGARGDSSYPHFRLLVARG